MEDIKKLVADLVAKQSAVIKENETITKGLIKVSSTLDNYAKEMEELEQFQQQITYIASKSQCTQSVSTSSNYQKAIDINEPQQTLEQAKKKPIVLLQKPIVATANEEKEKPTSCQEAVGKAIHNAKKEVLSLKSLLVEELPSNVLKL
ncbi:hypothetical protein DSO57_1005799 [Entomophthora muscae]|uniref:Uncharacterized protein n=1 Tax=Entomophthora muscae TaxID=34485 RepID=A0ACC2TIH6_9FUNG|nr:hypothetical protein DSO57_1005799 [Entomophthora muscae]